MGLFPVPECPISAQWSLAADNRRQNRLVDAGYRLVRFTAADVLSAPEAVVALVRRALI